MQSDECLRSRYDILMNLHDVSLLSRTLPIYLNVCNENKRSVSLLSIYCVILWDCFSYFYVTWSVHLFICILNIYPSLIFSCWATYIVCWARMLWLNLLCLWPLLDTLTALPNQELAVLYGGPTLNYREQLSLYVPHMLRVNVTRDLAHLQLSDLQGEVKPICRTSDLQEERMLICRT